MKYLLKSMQMARSTYYFELSKADQVAVRNHCLADEIKDIFSQHKGRYGVRRVYLSLSDVVKLADHTESGFCTACFGGGYPTSVPQDSNKDRFECKISEREKQESV